jgi:hypothetical protein
MRSFREILRTKAVLDFLPERDRQNCGDDQVVDKFAFPYSANGLSRLEAPNTNPT